jgi:hypothetical protein
LEQLSRRPPDIGKCRASRPSAATSTSKSLAQLYFFSKDKNLIEKSA